MSLLIAGAHPNWDISTAAGIRSSGGEVCWLGSDRWWWRSAGWGVESDGEGVRMCLVKVYCASGEVWWVCEERGMDRVHYWLDMHRIQTHKFLPSLLRKLGSKVINSQGRKSNIKLPRWLSSQHQNIGSGARVCVVNTGTIAFLIRLVGWPLVTHAVQTCLVYLTHLSPTCLRDGQNNSRAARYSDWLPR